MKREKFEQMRKEAEVLSVFGQKNLTTAKKVLNLDATINKIETWTSDKVVTEVNDFYKPILKRLPKEIRGTTMKLFCDTMRDIIRENGYMFALNKGYIVPSRVLAKVTKRGNKELTTLLLNLVLDGAKDNLNAPINLDHYQKAPILTSEMDNATLEAVSWMLEVA